MGFQHNRYTNFKMFMRDSEKLSTKKTIPIYTPTSNVSQYVFPEILITNTEGCHFLFTFDKFLAKYPTFIYIYVIIRITCFIHVIISL